MEDKWEVIAFESARGEMPVEEFIRSLDKSAVSNMGLLVKKYIYYTGLRRKLIEFP